MPTQSLKWHGRKTAKPCQRTTTPSPIPATWKEIGENSDHISLLASLVLNSVSGLTAVIHFLSYYLLIGIRAFWHFDSLWRKTMEITPSQPLVALTLLSFLLSSKWKVRKITDRQMHTYYVDCIQRFVICELCTCPFFSSNHANGPTFLTPHAAATNGRDGGASPHSFYADLPWTCKTGVDHTIPCPRANAGGQQRLVCYHHHSGHRHSNAHWLIHVLLQRKHHRQYRGQQHLHLCARYGVQSYAYVFSISHDFVVWQTHLVSKTDPDVPFLPPVPFSNHVLSHYDDMEIQCRVSDPNTNVTLLNADTQQPVPSIYDSKRGALGIFTAGTYVCKAVINGEEHYSEEYIVHGWTGVVSRICEFVIFKKKSDISTQRFHWICGLKQAISPYHLLHFRWRITACWTVSQNNCSAGGRHYHR